MKLDIEVVTTSSLPSHTLRNIYAEVDWKELQYQLAKTVEAVVHDAMKKQHKQPGAFWVSAHNVKLTRK